MKNKCIFGHEYAFHHKFTSDRYCQKCDIWENPKQDQKDDRPYNPSGKFVRYEYDLLSVAQELVMNCSGSSDCLTREQIKRYLEFIKFRLNSWEEDCFKLTADYSEAVRKLLIEAVKMAEKHVATWNKYEFDHKVKEIKEWA